MIKISRIILLFIVTVFVNQASGQDEGSYDQRILFHIVDLNEQELKFYWKNDQEQNFGNFQNLKNWLELNSKDLVFAMNGGMYKQDLSPQGLFIEDGVRLADIDTMENGYGNFYMHPNGIFYITKDKKGGVCKTSSFDSEDVKYATQSGPLLLIDGKIHAKFKKGSKNIHIRNGVGVLPNGNILFAMSKEKINFYDFANYFKSLDCKNALYLDGFVSKTYLPEKACYSMDGNFGVIIGETRCKK